MSRIVLILSILAFGAFTFAFADGKVAARQAKSSPLPAKLIARHQAFGDCFKLDDPNMPQRDVSFRARLDRNTEMYGILCEPSAYNWPSVIYIVRDGYVEDAERIYFADYSGATGWTGTNLIFNAYFDKNSRELRGFAKSRGLGDCGSKSRLRWINDQFSLIEFRYKERCDEKMGRFPLIYKRGGIGRRR